MAALAAGAGESTLQREKKDRRRRHKEISTKIEINFLAELFCTNLSLEGSV
jgi:hypothetical protein